MMILRLVNRLYLLQRLEHEKLHLRRTFVSLFLIFDQLFGPWQLVKVVVGPEGFFEHGMERNLLKFDKHEFYLNFVVDTRKITPFVSVEWSKVMQVNNNFTNDFIVCLKAESNFRNHDIAIFSNESFVNF